MFSLKNPSYPEFLCQTHCGVGSNYLHSIQILRIQVRWCLATSIPTIHTCWLSASMTAVSLSTTFSRGRIALQTTWALPPMASTRMWFGRWGCWWCGGRLRRPDIRLSGWRTTWTATSISTLCLGTVGWQTGPWWRTASGTLTSSPSALPGSSPTLQKLSWAGGVAITYWM